MQILQSIYIVGMLIPSMKVYIPIYSFEVKVCLVVTLFPLITNNAQHNENNSNNSQLKASRLLHTDSSHHQPKLFTFLSSEFQFILF